MLAALPRIEGQTVLDLGCGVGDLAAELSALGARVIGVDANEELLSDARARQIPNAEFVLADLRNLPDLGLADGVWCSFGAAYFTDLSSILALWARHLRRGGWIALTEIDDMFGHEPLAPRTRALLDAYARDALAARRYDFQMGRKLRDHLERSGFAVEKQLVLTDRELAFDGAASPDVHDAWRTRLDRMTLLHEFCGDEWLAVRDDFLACLARGDHIAAARVYFCIARTPAPV
jgi:ubiquinone/menaquinone biosynthesis C-methylase UbiE